MNDDWDDINGVEMQPGQPADQFCAECPELVAQDDYLCAYHRRMLEVLGTELSEDERWEQMRQQAMAEGYRKAFA